MEPESDASAVTIRRAMLSDEAAVREVFAASFGTQCAGAYSGADLRALLPALCTPNAGLLAGGTYYVAERAGGGRGAVVGCGGWSRGGPLPGDRQAHLRHFATDPAWGGRSVGRSIFARCLVDCREKGVRVLEVYSTLNATGFYAKLGFREVEEREICVGGVPMKVVLMRRADDDVDGLGDDTCPEQKRLGTRRGSPTTPGAR